MDDSIQRPSERELFDQAMELPDGADLAKFLDAACRGDKTLVDRIAALVKSSMAPDIILPDEPSAWTSGLEKPGQLIGNYRLEEMVGHGAFGVVWLAEQLEPVQRQVAIKILKLGLDTLAVISRFEAERQALAVMDHPNIANVYDAGATAAGRPYFVMDYLDGEPLFAFADSRRLTVEARLALMKSVVAAVQHAHQKGIIHRDLKSSNILVMEIDGKAVPKVIDFGIAKMTSSPADAEMTLTPASWGTPAFMSPEQLAGEPVDIRTDIFSLGMILYQLLSGSVAPRSSSENCPDIAPSRCLMRSPEERQKRMAAARSTSPRQLAKELKGELDWIVLRATAAKPAQRYDSAGALNVDLALFQDGRPVAAGPLSKPYLVGKFVRRHRGKLAVAALAFLTMFAATVVSLIFARQAKAASLAMEDALYEARLMEAGAVRQSGRIGQRTRALAAVAAAVKIRPTAELRDEAIAAMALPDVELIATLDAIPESKRVFAYDFVSDLLVTGRTDEREIQRWRIETGEQLEPVPLGASLVGSNKLYISPGGKIIAVYGKPMIKLLPFLLTFYEVVSGRVICEVRDANYDSHGCAFYDSASKVLVPMAKGGLAEIDLQTGKELRHIDTGSKVGHISVNAAGTQFLVGSRDTQKMQLIDAASGAIIKAISPPSAAVESALAPGGRLLAWGDGKGTARCVSLAKVEAGKLSSPVKLEGHRNLIQFVHFVLDGDYIVTASWDGTVRLWSPTGSQSLILEGNGVWVSPDGRRMLIYHGYRVSLFQLVPPREATTFSQPVPSKAAQMAFSPDSSMAAICSEEGTTLVALPDTQVLASFGTGHRSASFDPDGQTLYTAGEDGLRSWDLNAVMASPSAATRHLLSDHSTVLDATQRASIARSADNSLLAIASLHLRDGNRRLIRVMESGTGNTVIDIPWKGEDITSLLFDPRGRWLAGSYWRGKGATVWDTTTWKPIANLAIEVGSMKLAVNHDGSRLATSSSREICLWDTASWECAQRIHCELVSSQAKPVDFSPDGSILAYRYDGTRIRLRRLSDGANIATLTLPVLDHLKQIKFSPDGRYLGVSGETRSFFFDLQRIGEGLSELGLALEMP